MLEVFVNRNTKEILLTLTFEENVDCKGNVYNDEYDAIMLDSKYELEDMIIEKDGKKYLNYEYVKS